MNHRNPSLSNLAKSSYPMVDCRLIVGVPTSDFFSGRSSVLWKYWHPQRTLLELLDRDCISDTQGRVKIPKVGIGCFAKKPNGRGIRAFFRPRMTACRPVIKRPSTADEGRKYNESSTLRVEYSVRVIQHPPPLAPT
ncbi:Hypothetical protein NTJ_11028 [Nesidiocoris tenuis]|uniref:Uncharacterized protein n=1 Tax=Nesidiocoris tenuis TaxID=355587 RepID=A0ABN7B1U3_9HEMI|nr:Hypothetical protein NTJ_11028 [Nesidiocoris tenuis]